ncbi:hypothetical protein C8R46DRAFT_1074321 [Mycena filopes]|nr:hypothetical protein C8R46DRAFT_1074321 [Mycena filopes]
MPPTILEEDSPLPPNPFAQLHRSYLAYDLVLAAEKEAVLANNTDNIMKARVVGFTILHAPGKQHVVLEALENPTAQRVYGLGLKYLKFFILPFRREYSSPPPPSAISTPLYLQTEGQVPPSAALCSPDHKTAKRWALTRDGLRCILSGKYDISQVKASPELKTKLKTEGLYAQGTLQTQCAHILPLSINPSQSTPAAVLHSANVLRVLRMVSGLSEHLVDSLNGAGVNQLGNILTIGNLYRGYFNTLALWLEAIEGKVNEYRICYVPHITVDSFLPETIKFTTTNAALNLPCADLLALHAAACRVAHLSGAANYLDSTYQDESGIPLSEAEFATQLDRRLQLSSV